MEPCPRARHPPPAQPRPLRQGDEGRHVDLRQRACDLMAERRADFEPFVEDDQGFDGYVKQMRKVRARAPPARRRVRECSPRAMPPTARPAAPRPGRF